MVCSHLRGSDTCREFSRGSGIFRQQGRRWTAEQVLVKGHGDTLDVEHDEHDYPR